MSLWRREALARFPELRREIADADSSNEMWWQFFQHLKDAYHNEPIDETFIGTIYDYALWCLKHRSVEVRTAVVISFFGSLHDDARVRRDLPCRISQEDFDMLGFAWEYGTKQAFAELRREFNANKTRIEKAKRTKRQPSVFD